MGNRCLPFGDEVNVFVVQPDGMNQQCVAVEYADVVQVLHRRCLLLRLNLVVFGFGFGDMNLEEHICGDGSIFGLF